MLRILVFTAILGTALGSLAAAHEQGAPNAEDPVTCAGGSDYTKTYATQAAGTSATVYLVNHQADLTQGGLSDTDKASPVSLWLENNGRSKLQTSAFECTYLSDGHPYAGNHPSLQRREPDQSLVAAP